MITNRFFNKPGFTLIELLVVITVIGILATLIIANFSSARSRARDTRRKSDLQQMKTALRLYYNDHQEYPADSGNVQIACCSFGSAFAVSGEEYMKQLPLDPLNTGNYVYRYNQLTADTYQLYTYLENTSDQDDTLSQTRCGIATGSVVDQRYMVCED